jgi:hypothetical protein
MPSFLPGLLVHDAMASLRKLTPLSNEWANAWSTRA